jgi:hypothetical protein
MSKTPYEIRLELLKLAKDSLYEPVFQQRHNLMEEYQSKREVFPGMSGPTEEQLALQFPTMPDFPGTDTIIAEAEKLNQFVSQQ